MKENLFKRAPHILTEAFQNCMKRFPVTVCFVFALTVYLMYLVKKEIHDEDKLLMVLGYYFSIGSLLSLTLHLWSEETTHRGRKIIVHTVMHLLLIADAVFLYSLSPEQSFIEIGIAHGAGILALGISVFFLSFINEKNDIPSWNFASYTIGSFVTVNIIGYVMSGGISLLILSLHMLFGVDVSNKCYLYILVLFSVLLPALLFLGMLPKGHKKHNAQPQSSDFLNGIIHFLFLPLIAGYLIVLYIYAARILSSWELPTGWVSWLVVALMAGCIAIEFGLYPTRIKQGKRTDEWIARWLPALILPLLLLMTVGIVRRFNDYGITINRLYLITLNAWFYIVCIGLVIIKARRINWISISFALFFLLTSVLPVNYASITRDYMRNQIEVEIKRSANLKLPLSNEAYNAWLKSLPINTAVQINDKFMYLNNWFGWTSISDWVAKDISFYNAFHKYNSDSEDFSGNATSFIEYSGRTNNSTTIKIPEGYNQFVNIQNKIAHLPGQYMKTGILPIYVHSQTGTKNDTVYINLKTLETLGGYKHNEMPLTTFKCNSSKSLFMLRNFTFTYDKKGDIEIYLNIDGYLFKK